MKRDITIIMISILTAFLTISCGDANKAEFKQIVWKIFPDLHTDNTSYVVIIPNQGCGGCITAAEYFYKEHKDREELKFIFTNVISIKMLQQKVEINGSNTYLDAENEVLLAYPQNKVIYPCVLELGGNGIENIYYQSPDENGLSIVENELAKL